MNKKALSIEIEKEGLELVIGLEAHIRLNTKSKLFCTCPNHESEKPNQNICSVCTGQMGVLPALNKEAISKDILFGKSIESSFSNEIISWDRKHYEYPDQPKNFQLTQFKKPIIPDGKVHCFRNITRVAQACHWNALKQRFLAINAAVIFRPENSTRRYTVHTNRWC